MATHGAASSTEEHKISVDQDQLVRFLKKSVAARRPTLITGAPGVGKTEIGKAVARDSGANLYIAHPVVDSPVNYRGFPFVGKDGQADFIPFGFLRRMVEAKNLLVVILDDLGQAPPAVQAACMQLLLERSINGEKISDEVVFIACTNRKEDMAGVAGILEPVKSRFITILELFPRLEPWIGWYLKTGLPIQVAAFIRFASKWLFDFKATKDMTNSPCPRTLENLGRLVAMNLDADLRFPAYSGAVGKACATEYLAFEQMYDKMLDPAVVIMQPSTVPIPTTPDGLFATCMGVAHYANEHNIDNIAIFGKRLPPDFRVMMMDDIVRKDPTLQRSKPFIEFYCETHQKHIS
jgi:hypothetical protein